jgi:HTH-type transcriptional regulator/antitoxin HigA
MWWWTSGIAEDEDHDRALKYIEPFFDSEPALRSPHGDMFTYWANEISRYEQERWPIDRWPDP